VEDGRDVIQLKGVPQSDRASHFYIIGASGKGKTKFMEYLIRQDMQNNLGNPSASGFGVIDPHGDLYREVKACLEAESGYFKERVVLIDPTDEERSVCFNPLELTEGVSAAQQAKELVTAFEKIYDAWGDRLAALLRNALIVLIENGLTLAELPACITDDAFRKRLLRNVKNQTCLDYFEKDFDEWSKREKVQWRQSTLNKIDAFLSDERIKRIFVSSKSTFNLREIMDSGKILLVNLSKGELGEEGSKLLGSLLLAKFQMAAMRRGTAEDEGRRPFYLYIDEFQNFASDNFLDIINETRKYNLRLTIAHQNLAQLPLKLRLSILNCGLQAYFQINRPDAEIISKEAFPGVFEEMPSWEECFTALQNIPKRQFWFKSKQVGGMAPLLVPEVFSWRDKSLGDGTERRLGDIYTRPNEDIEKKYQARREALLAGEKETDDFYDK
jgi:type IV secretory pathway TraG/TraD family ATPase VirD4